MCPCQSNTHQQHAKTLQKVHSHGSCKGLALFEWDQQKAAVMLMNIQDNNNRLQKSADELHPFLKQSWVQVIVQEAGNLWMCHWSHYFIHFSFASCGFDQLIRPQNNVSKNCCFVLSQLHCELATESTEGRKSPLVKSCWTLFCCWHS